MSTFCKIVLGIYLALCVVSLALIPISAKGVWGIEPDALASVFAVILASPWVQLIGRWAIETSLIFNFLILVVGMLINTIILIGLCRWFHGRKISKPQT